MHFLLEGNQTKEEIKDGCKGKHTCEGKDSKFDGIQRF